MASADGTYSAQQIDQLLRCPVCLDRFNSPKILPCQHTFCKSPCLETLCDFGSRKIKCPECRAEHYVPYNGIDGFANNLTLSSFLDLPVHNSPRRETPDPGSPNKCGICEKDGSTEKCFHCDKLTCVHCRQSHHRQLKLDIGRLVNQVRRAIPKLSNSISSVEQKSEQVKQQVEGIKSEINNTIERLTKELNDRRKLLNSELETFQQGELRSLRLQQENKEVDLASIASYCDTTESTLNIGGEGAASMEELVSMRRQCGEYMEQARQAETDPLILLRNVRFTYDSTVLQESILNFGELVVHNPGSSNNPQVPTTPTPQVPTPQALNSSNQRQRWNNPQPLHSIYFSNYTPEPSPDPTPRTTPRATPHPPTSHRPSSNPAPHLSSSYYSHQLAARASSDITNDRTSREGQSRDAANQSRGADYMFTMRPPDNIAEEMEELIESMERNPLTSHRRRVYDRRNTSSIFGNEPYSPREEGRPHPVSPRAALTTVNRPVRVPPAESFTISFEETPVIGGATHHNNERSRPEQATNNNNNRELNTSNNAPNRSSTSTLASRSRPTNQTASTGNVPNTSPPAGSRSLPTVLQEDNDPSFTPQLLESNDERVVVHRTQARNNDNRNQLGNRNTPGARQEENSANSEQTTPPRQPNQNSNARPPPGNRPAPKRKKWTNPRGRTRTRAQANDVAGPSSRNSHMASTSQSHGPSSRNSHMASTSQSHGPSSRNGHMASSSQSHDEMPVPTANSFQRSGTFVREEGSSPGQGLPVVATTRGERFDIRL